MKKLAILAAIGVFTALGCKQGKLIETEKKSLKDLGNSVSTQAQTDLMKNLTKAIEEGGFAHAIDYCNLNASKITNTQVDGKKIISVQRLSNKNRNVKNVLSNPEDLAMYEYFMKQSRDTLVEKSSQVIYYKPIKIVMPTCLKCHGSQKELESVALDKIQQHYPKDLARNYKMGDLRGIWKITMHK